MRLAASTAVCERALRGTSATAPNDDRSCLLAVVGVFDEVTLQSVIELRKDRGDRIDAVLCVKVAIECCDAVRRAPAPKAPEARHVIRPETLALSRDGYARLLVKDWGECDAGIDPQFAYLSPELAKGLRSDERSDVFILGIILWELLAGRRLFVGESDYQTVELVREAFVPALTSLASDVDARLEVIVGTAVAEAPADRYENLKELSDALADYLTSRGLVSTPYDLRELL
jgi:hypothetical protein